MRLVILKAAHCELPLIWFLIMTSLSQLLSTLPQDGRLEWIGVRPGRGEAMQATSIAEVEIGTGLVDDRYRGNAESKRQVTLIQAEHLEVIGRLLGRASVEPQLLRRNLVISGINLLALQRSRFSIGELQLEGTGQCHPCSRMEEALGAGGYNAVRGHGGITARVHVAATIRVGDAVRLVEAGGLSRHET
jgi:MOSC domain-containing protein YiiM